MLERDRYEADQCMQHFPMASYDEFCRHIFGGISFRRLFMRTNEFDESAALRNNLIFGTLLVSLLPIIFHKKIYFFRNYQSRKARIFMGIGWFFIPSNIVGAYFQQQNTRQLTAKYELNRQQFLKFLEEGDTSITNPKQEWAQF